MWHKGALAPLLSTVLQKSQEFSEFSDSVPRRFRERSGMIFFLGFIFGLVRQIRTAMQHMGGLSCTDAVALASFRGSSGTLPVPTISDISYKIVSIIVGPIISW